MAFTQVTSESWFGRIGKSFIGVLVGIALFVGALVALWWNEGNSVKTAEGLKECEAKTVSLAEPKIDPANDHKPVHFSGMAETTEVLSDPEFGIEATAIHLRRKVEMYQWEEDSKSETKNKLGGGTETVTTYSYNKTWSENLIDSSGFHDPSHPENPSSMPLKSETWDATEVTVGEYALSSSLIGQMDKYVEIKPPVPAPAGYTPQGNTLYKSANPSSPQIGDLRVTLQEVKPAVVSIVAVQNGDNLEPYHTARGKEVQLLEEGTVTAAAMFKNAQDANTVFTWIIRAVGLVVLIIACSLALAPIGVIADVVPFFGSIARFGTFLLSLVVAIPVAMITIGLAWIAYRPLLAIGLFAVAVVVPAVLLIMRKKKPVPAAEPRTA